MTSNPERSASTRAQLVAAARRLFALHGYAGTSTESILEAAGVRRGGMYHHFDGKGALFEAVCAALCEEAVPPVEAAVRAAENCSDDPLEPLIHGSIAWIAFMTRPEVRRILIVDAPTVLGWERWDALDARLSREMLREGIVTAIDAGALRFSGDPELLVTLFNGALNALALRLGAPQGGARDPASGRARTAEATAPAARPRGRRRTDPAGTGKAAVKGREPEPDWHEAVRALWSALRPV